jgi:hypothetical protein
VINGDKDIFFNITVHHRSSPVNFFFTGYHPSMPLPTSELKLGYELFSKLLNWAAGKRQSKRLEERRAPSRIRLRRDEASRDAPQGRARRATWFVVQGT